MKRYRQMPVLTLGLALILTAGCARTEAVREAPSDDEEMISIGYGKVAKDNVTTPVAVVSRDDIERRKVTDAALLLQSRVPGLQVVQTPTGARLRIRGIHTFMGSKDPLFVLDGAPLPPDPSGSILFLNPSDIERIEVLKGAAASIYGTRGTNGVVLITTRTGR